MKSTKSFNNISDKLRKEIPQLKRGERVLFQMLNGVPNPEPDEKERSRQGAMLYGKVQLSTNFRIWDPYQKNDSGEEVGGFVDVGCVEAWDKEYPAKFRFFVAGLTAGQKSGSFFQGKFELSGDSDADKELFEILWLSNQREGNPNADASTEKIFKIVDSKSETANTTSKFEKAKKALELANKFDEKSIDGAKAILAALNKPKYTDNTVLLAAVKEVAMTDYETFLKVYNDPTTNKKYTIQNALDAGIISHDFSTGVLTMGKTKLTDVAVENVVDVPGAIVQWLGSTSNGAEIMSAIEKQLAEKTEVVK